MTDFASWLSEVAYAFPRLSAENAVPTSEADKKYNCFAWALGDTTQWWDHRRHWPAEISRVYSFEVYQAVFELQGYALCISGEVERGYDKVALFADEATLPTHASRQLADGRWTSKIGEDIDIVHVSPEDVSGGLYGDIAAFLRRAVKGPPA